MIPEITAFTWQFAVGLIVFAFLVGFGWTLGCAVMAALLGKVKL